MKRIASIGVTLIIFSVAAPAWADYQAGVDAYQSGDFKTAMAEWLPLAEEGDATAQNSVGALYDHGLGVDESDSDAAHWYSLAADQGLPLAMRNLAGMYAGGYGVPFDKDQAIYWYDKAAAAGDEQAVKRLAALDPSRAPVPAPEPAATPQPAVAPMTVAGDGNDEPMDDDAPLPVPTDVAAGQAPAAETTASQPAEPAAEIAAMPSSDDDLQYGEGTATAAGSTQEANVAAPPTAQSEPGNWIMGQWQGPSLGCPPGGGLEFAPGETRSYFGGRVAATLAASYQVKGDIITVVTTGVDGVGHSYEYKRTAPDRFVISAVPPEMPSSMIGAEHRRCGPAPTQSTAAPAAATPAAPSAAAMPAAAAPAKTAPATTAPAISAPAAPASTPTNVATKPAASVAAAAPATGNATAAPVNPGTPQAGWDAFGRGDYRGALAIWTPLAEAGDPNIQVLVGSIYDYGQGVPQDDAEAVKWYEMAANQGNAKAQYQTGAVYARSPQVKDPLQGYKWLTIAAKTIGTGNVGGVTADQATTLRALVAMDMSKAQIAEAEAAAAAFKAK